MKANLFRRVMLPALTFVFFSNAMPVMAQKLASDNKNLFGVWYMEWFQFDKESEKIHIKNSMYTHVKVYRPDGEYACLLMSVKKDGGINILPHEHGTYSYKKGEYIEMGRKMVPGQSEFYMVDENTKGGRWYNRIDESKKVKDCPKGLENYLLECSRSGVTPPSGKMIKMIKKHIFGIEK